VATLVVDDSLADSWRDHAKQSNTQLILASEPNPQERQAS
jgi:hypothetical protein